MQNRQCLTPIRTPNTTDDNCPYIAKAARKAITPQTVYTALVRIFPLRNNSNPSFSAISPP